MFFFLQGTPKRQAHENSGSHDSGISNTVGPESSMNMSVELPNHHHQEHAQPHQHHGVKTGGADSGIPEDPLLAETHYSQFEDFEADESSYSDSEDDDYEAFLGCIEEALELPNQPGKSYNIICVLFK